MQDFKEILHVKDRSSQQIMYEETMHPLSLIDEENESNKRLWTNEEK